MGPSNRELAQRLRNPLGLTDRQCEVMRALCKTGEVKLVARELAVTRKSVDSTLRCVRKRANVKNNIILVMAWDRAANRPTRIINSVFAMGTEALKDEEVENEQEASIV